MSDEILLDIDRIRTLRRDRGLSARAMESALGVGGGWWHSLESGANHPHITLREFLAIASELGADPADLLANRPATASSPNDPEALRNDAVRLGCVLADLNRQTPVSKLAAGLGWTLDRTEAALEVLNVGLPGVGRRLVRGVAGVQVVRRSPEPDPAVEELISERISGAGLTPVQAAVLARVVRGELAQNAATEATMSNHHRVALAELVNAGLVTAPQRRLERYAPTAQVRTSLLMPTNN